MHGVPFAVEMHWRNKLPGQFTLVRTDRARDWQDIRSRENVAETSLGYSYR